MRQLVILIGVFLALAGLASAATVNLAWNANTEADLASYKVHRSASSCAGTGTFTSVGTVAKPATTFTDTLAADGTYCYYITALDTAGNESGPSNKVEAIVNVNPPLAPTGLRATVTP